MVTGAEGITGLVLVGYLIARLSNFNPSPHKITQNYRLSLPARQTESPRWLIAIPGKVVKPWLSHLPNKHAYEFAAQAHQFS